MKTDCITIFFLSSFVTFLSRGGSLSDLRDEGINIRRILHQPLFPSTSPPPPSDPDMPDPANQPFFHQPPVGPTPDHSQHSLPTPVSDSIAATQAHSPTKRVAIGITSGILTMALLSALAFYLYKRRSNHPDEARKLFGLNPQRAHEESGMPPSSFLYIGTVNPSTTSVDSETNCRANGSPYRKLKPGKISERYRPSPDLQPLPPLPRALPPTVNSPPPMSSSDDESRGAGFYTSKNNHLSLSRKASPKSRMSARPSIVPSIKQLPPPESSSLGPLQPSKTLAYTPSRAKHAAPPPPPDIAKLRSISSDDKQTRKIPIPPPPPSIHRKFGSMGPNTPSPVVSKPVTKPESESPSPMSIPRVSSSEKCHREEKDGSKPKLKALHWDKVRATSERATVWDQLKSSSFQLNEDAMESLFGCNSAISESRTRKPTLEQENRVLDPKKSQNIAILIRALNVTREEVSEALLDGNPDGLGVELLETLVKMAPTKEEEIKLKDYNGDISRLGSAERFLKKILDVPFAFKRVEAMLYRANFDTEVAYLRNSFRTLEEASEELKSSRLFLKLLEAVLRTGNRMNDGTNRGDARAFKLNTLLKLVDVKGADGKTTLLHFVVQEIIRSEGSQTNFKQEEFRKQGLQVVSGLSKELGNIRKAAGMDSDVLTGYVSKLETGLEKVRLVTQYEGGKFSVSMKEFLREAVGEIARIKREERIVMSRVKELTEYFHGDAAKEEAHPLRIFLIVRDFLGILGNVCRDVGRMQDNGATMAVGRSFKMPNNKSRIEIVQFGLNDLFKE